MEGSSSIAGAPVSIARRRLRILAGAFVGILITSVAGAGGYVTYTKIQEKISENAYFTSNPVIISTQQSFLSPKISSLNSMYSINQTTISVIGTISNSVPNLPSILYKTTDSQSVTPKDNLLSTKSSTPTEVTTLTSIGQTSIKGEATSTLTKATTIISSKEETSTTVKTTSNSSKAYTLSSTSERNTTVRVLSSSTKINTITFTEQSTNAKDRVSSTKSYTHLDTTSSLPHSCSTRPIASLNALDPCVDESSTMCKNGSQIGNVPNYCECDADGLWTIIQRRFDGSVDFYCNWTDYKAGFGDLDGEFWLGNDAIHQITSGTNYTLKIYLTGWDNVTKYAQYNAFRLSDEADGYRLTIRGYSGDAGDSLITYHDGQMFSTKDRDNDSSQYLKMAQYFSGPWWFGYTADSSLNGPYQFEPYVTGGYGIVWLYFNDSIRYSMKETRMLIKTN